MTAATGTDVGFEVMPGVHSAAMRSRFPSVLTPLAVALLAVTLVGFCGAWAWAFDLASHFRGSWLVAAAVVVVLAARRPRSLACGCSALAVVINAWALAPFWLPGPAAPAVNAVAGSGGTLPPLSLVCCNVCRDNPDTSRAIAYLADRRPDVAVLLEIDAAWVSQLAELDETYRFRFIEPREDGFGLAVLSRWPLSAPRVFAPEGMSQLQIAVTVCHHGRDVQLFATHPRSPLSPWRWSSLSAQLGALADMVATEPHPCIVAGDFNATPWSAAYRVFAARSGLRDTALGRGVQATWNARFPAPRIPIDHVFVSPDVAVVRRAVGPDVGSDHFPVEVTLALPPAD